MFVSSGFKPCVYTSKFRQKPVSNRKKFLYSCNVPADWHFEPYRVYCTLCSCKYFLLSSKSSILSRLDVSASVVPRQPCQPWIWTVKRVVQPQHMSLTEVKCCFREHFIGRGQPTGYQKHRIFSGVVFQDLRVACKRFLPVPPPVICSPLFSPGGTANSNTRKRLRRRLDMLRLIQ